MKNKKLLFLAATLLLGAGSLASCGGGDNVPKLDTTTPVTIWAANDDQAFITQVVANFRAANPDYAETVINVAAMEEPEVPAALKTDLNASADVFHFAGDQIGEMVKFKYLYNMPKSLIEGNGIAQSVLDAGKVGKGQYGIPFTPNTYFMYYDASVYSAEDILSLDAMLAKTDTGYQYNTAIDFGGWYLQSMFFSNGCTIFGANGNEQAKGIEPVEKAYETAKFVYDGLTNAKIKAGGAGTVGADCAAGISGTWDAEGVRERITAKGGTYACAPLPKLTIGGKQVAWKSVGDYKHVGVKSTTKNPRLAAQLAAYITNAESQKLRYTLRQTAPTNIETASDTTIQWDAAIVAQTAQLANTFAQPTIYTSQNYWDPAAAFGDDLKALGTGASTADINAVFDSFNSTIKTA
jgi:arabinogalactan oligomer/maltooligosaccharide transport system substrate-binding protein